MDLVDPRLLGRRREDRRDLELRPARKERRETPSRRGRPRPAAARSRLVMIVIWSISYTAPRNLAREPRPACAAATGKSVALAGCASLILGNGLTSHVQAVRPVGR